MKIAIARQKYTPYGGAERFIAREWTGDPAGMLQVNPFYLGRTRRDLGFSHHVQRIINAGRFDLVQSHERIPGYHVYRAGGLPVLTSTTCGAAELIVPGKNGQVCDALDGAALVRQLDALCAPGIADGMRAAAREAVAALGTAGMAS